jgi:hypothetical protein
MASKEISLEVNADRTKYKTMSWDQNAPQNSNMQAGNKTFEKVKQLKYWRTTPQKNKIPFVKKLRADLIQAILAAILCSLFLSSSLLSKNVKVKT